VTSRFSAGFKTFFNHILQGPIFQARVRIYLLETGILMLKVAHTLNILNFHPAGPDLPLHNGNGADEAIKACQ